MSATETNDCASSGHEWQKIRHEAMTSIKSIDLPDDLDTPGLPSALSDFLDASAGTEYDVAALTRIIEVDPGMTMDVLKWVNVATSGNERPINSPGAALIRMGVPKTRNYLIAAGMRRATSAYNSRLVNHEKFWNESLRRALFAQQAAIRLKADAELAFIGGLLQDFVLPGLTNQFDTRYIEYMRDAAPQGIALSDWETETFGWNHAGVGAYVAHQWHMPEDLLSAVLYHHRMDLTVRADTAELFHLFPVTLAALLPDQLLQVPGGLNRLLDADAKSSILQLDEMCASVDGELANIVKGDVAPLWLAPIVQQAREPLAQ